MCDVISFLDVVVEDEMNREQEHVVDVVWLCVECVEDVIGYWWRWKVRCGFEPMKEEESVESIWQRRLGFGGHESMRWKMRTM